MGTSDVSTGVAITMALLALVSGCRSVHRPSEPGTAVTDGSRLSASKAMAKRAFVEVIGTRAAIHAAGLAQMDGVVFDDHSATPLAGDRVRLAVHVASEDIVERIRAKGLAVRVLQTADQLRDEEERIVRRLGTGDAGSIRR